MRRTNPWAASPPSRTASISTRCRAPAATAPSRAPRTPRRYARRGPRSAAPMARRSCRWTSRPDRAPTWAGPPARRSRTSWPSWPRRARRTDMPWQYANPVRITAGDGALQALGGLVPANSRVLLVTSAGNTRRGVTARVSALLEAARCAVTVLDRVTPNPELDTLEQFAAEHAAAAPDAIVALGGGSAIDAGKILSVMLPHGEPAALQ